MEFFSEKQLKMIPAREGQQRNPIVFLDISIDGEKGIYI